jgi:mitochondrial import inner membrane translocase subunit TIM50
MPNVPKDIPIPHTLVLDLENTLVSSTWDRKFGWRHAKRPGVDQFLRTMAEYYEIVLYSPSIDGVADPAVTSLDKAGCIMHRLYRDATHYHNGTHVKDLNRLNRDINRIVLLDDDGLAAQFNPDNLIRIKPYEDSSDRTDRSLERITPFLVELARSGTKDVPSILRQYRGMDADQIADEYDRRIDQFKYEREQRSQRGLGGMAGGSRARLPPPEAEPEVDYGRTTPAQLTAKDLVGAAPVTQSGGGGMMGWMNKRAMEKEEQKMLKMEKWNEVMIKKQREKRAAAEADASRT